MFNAADSDEPCIRYMVEGHLHGMFEVRFHRLNYRGDASSASYAILGVKDVNDSDDEAPLQETNTTMRRVTFESNDQPAASVPTKKQEARREQLYFYQKFHCLNYYYKKVAEKCGTGIVPCFYRFKMSPMNEPFLSRVYEVEEHVGRSFIEEIAEMHMAHLKSIEHARIARNKRSKNMFADDYDTDEL